MEKVIKRSRDLRFNLRKECRYYWYKAIEEMLWLKCEV